MFGNGHVDTSQHGVETPVVSAAQTGVSATSQAEQNTPALMGRGDTWTSSGISYIFESLGQWRIRRPVRLCVLGVADFAYLTQQS